MKTREFLLHWHTQAQALYNTVETEFLVLPHQVVNTKPDPARWSALECIEHLNRYNRFYIPIFTKALASGTLLTEAETVRYSWLGRKSIEMVDPANGKKYNTLKSKNPQNSQLSTDVLVEFLQHQKILLQTLAQAQGVDLNRKAIPIEIFQLLKLRTGEALEFFILHQQRHIQQAQRAILQAAPTTRLVV